MKANPETLTRKQEQAVAALLLERTIAAAAERAGISERTLSNWMRQDSFAAAYKAARREVRDQAVQSLQRSMGEAVEVMLGLLQSEDEAIQYRAAEFILERVEQERNREELEDRIAALEAASSTKGPGPKGDPLSRVQLGGVQRSVGA